jgi:hypothetical protein
MMEPQTKKRNLHAYFTSNKSRKISSLNETAETLAQRLRGDVFYLTDDGESWYLLKRKWLPSVDFDTEWNLHPTKRHVLKVYGKTVQENRWSQSWGVSYAYSGSTSIARPLEESKLVTTLIAKANEMTQDLTSTESPYNGCLQNWYEPDDTIGLHSDDERSQRHDCPIWSLSWEVLVASYFDNDRIRKSRLNCTLVMAICSLWVENVNKHIIMRYPSDVLPWIHPPPIVLIGRSVRLKSVRRGGIRSENWRRVGS